MYENTLWLNSFPKIIGPSPYFEVYTGRIYKYDDFQNASGISLCELSISINSINKPHLFDRKRHIFITMKFQVGWGRGTGSFGRPLEVQFFLFIDSWFDSVGDALCERLAINTKKAQTVKPWSGLRKLYPADLDRIKDVKGSSIYKINLNRNNSNCRSWRIWWCSVETLVCWQRPWTHQTRPKF